VVEKPIKAYVISMKHPSYTVLESVGKEEPIINQVTNLAYNTVNLTQRNPQQAKTLAKVFVLIGFIGLGILAITHFID
jgi:hypothetical protein